ncbi:MAG: asparaginase, partial [Acetobacter sp.]|nr:asparaginase [Acetobacter sp.]
ALPEQGLGIALKCRSGHIQATEAAAAAMIQRFGKIENPVLTHFMGRKLKNWNGQEVGELLVARDLQAKTSLPPITIR